MFNDPMNSKEFHDTANQIGFLIRDQMKNKTTDKFSTRIEKLVSYLKDRLTGKSK